MSFETVCLLISAFVSGALAGAALLKNLKSRLCVSFAFLALCLLVHDGFSAWEVFRSNTAVGNTIPRFHVFVTLLLAPAALWFVSTITTEHRKIMMRICYFLIPLPFLAVISSYVFGSEIYFFLLAFSHLFLLIPLIICAYAIEHRAERSTLTRERLRLRYAFWGAGLTFTFFLSDLFFWLGADVPPLGTFARTFYLSFLFQVFVQKEFITAEEVVARLALFGSVAVILSFIYALLVSWVGDQKGLFFFNTVIASLVVMILFDPIQKMTTKLTRRFFLRLSSRLETELEKLSADIMGIVESRALAERITTAFKRAVGVESVTMYVLAKDGLSYLSVGPSAIEEIPASNPLIEYMALRRGRPFVLETIENDRDSFHAASPRRFCESCLENLRALSSDFVVSFYAEQRVVGFCAIKTGEKVLLTNDQLRLFVPVARQIALLLKHTEAFTVIREHDKLAAVGEMAAGLAHEIKNPLGAIRGAAELLDTGNNQNEITQIILDETARLSGVLSDFLDYAKPRRNHPQTSCDPVHVIEHTAALALRDKNVRFSLHTEGEGITLEADPDVLKQIFLNLFLNALQAMEGQAEPSELSVRVREIRPNGLFSFSDSLPLYKTWEGWQPPSSFPANSYVEVSIADSGKGISPEDRERIFLPFFTRRSKGTGLGLAICQRLVEGMFGTISVKPNHPRGTVFVLHLPKQVKKIETSHQRFSLIPVEGGTL